MIAPRNWVCNPSRLRIRGSDRYAAGVRQLTHGPRHHFFGRAGVSPWNKSATRLACLESEIHGRAPLPGERAQVGVVDPNTGGFTAVGTTSAWSFMRGAMLQWCPQSPNDELLFNDVVDGTAVGVRLNVHTGARQVYMRAFAAAGGEGGCAVGLSPGRLARLDPDIAMGGARDPAPDDPAPDNDGLFLIGLTTGLHRLLLPIAAVAEYACSRLPSLRRREFWFDHVSFNTTGHRVIFTAFAGGGAARLDAALFTVGIDGGGLREAVPFGLGVVDGAWLGEGEGIAVFRVAGEGMAPRVFFDSDEPGGAPAAPGRIKNVVRAIPSPGGDRLAIVTENLRRRTRTLSIVDRRTGSAEVHGDSKAPTDSFFRGPARCELNPRWNNSGTSVCVDAIDTDGMRQVHIAQAEAKVSR